MASKDEQIQDLYVASYGSQADAEAGWGALKDLVAAREISVDALAFVSRDQDGKIHVKDTKDETGVGAAAGAIGGVLVGLLFPPSLLASAAVGAGLGAGTGAVVDRVTKRKVKSEVEWTVPAGGYGIAVVFVEDGVTKVETALRRATSISRTHLHDLDESETTDAVGVD